MPSSKTNNNKKKQQTVCQMKNTVVRPACYNICALSCNSIAVRARSECCIMDDLPWWTGEMRPAWSPLLFREDQTWSILLPQMLTGCVLRNINQFDFRNSGKYKSTTGVKYTRTIVSHISQHYCSLSFILFGSSIWNRWGHSRCVKMAINWPTEKMEKSITQSNANGSKSLVLWHMQSNI